MVFIKLTSSSGARLLYNKAHTDGLDTYRRFYNRQNLLNLFKSDAKAKFLALFEYADYLTIRNGFNSS